MATLGSDWQMIDYSAELHRQFMNYQLIVNTPVYADWEGGPVVTLGTNPKNCEWDLFERVA